MINLCKADLHFDEMNRKQLQLSRRNRGLRRSPPAPPSIPLPPPSVAPHRLLLMSNLCEQSIRNYAPPNVPILPPELSGSKTQVDLHRSPQANLLPPTTRLILSDSLDSTIESLYQTRIDNLVAAKALTFSPSSEESELVRHVEAANLYYKPPMLRNMSASKTTVQGTFVSPLLYVLKAIIQATSETEISFGDNTKQRDPGNFVVDYLFRRGLDGTPTVAVTIESYSLGESTGAAMHAALKDSTTEGVLLRNLQDREETSEVYNMLVKVPFV